MTPNSQQSISAKKVYEAIAEGLPLNDLIIYGDLEINGDEDFENPLIIENCIVENLKCMMVRFIKPVIFKSCHFKDASFSFCYFIKGLLIEDCIFDKDLDFQAGGHNELEHPILFSNNEFKGFVNFCDCWFNGEIVFNNNKFNTGTNIESKRQYLTFDIPLLMINNSGLTNIESEYRE
ncbi:hypothetical protein ACHMWN_00290 [Pedobacter sp. UC225_61]|uniref:hypothetical protein n=1 Tax=Pedobacter sp. UC225_61 TaxID=3374623 RepID=UPI0037A1F800